MEIDFSKGDGLVPAIVQSFDTRAVLMLGYMNQEAVAKTKESGKVHFFSRSKNRLWMKGETSGNILEFISMHMDCDNDTVLVFARASGPTCHRGTESCFTDAGGTGKNFLLMLEAIIEQRKKDKPENSYVSQLFNEGTKKIAQKVIEEAGETALEAVSGNQEQFLSESADLLFHYLVLLADRNMNIGQVLEHLGERQTKEK